MTPSLLPPKIASSRRTIAAAAVAAGVVALVTGCGSPGSSTPTATVTVTAAPSAPASSSQTTTSAPPTTPAGPAACATRDLKVKLGLGQGTAGSTYTNIDFTNIGTVTCTLYGYPGISLAGGSPIAQMGQAADEDPATPRELITLAPGAVANALLKIVDAGNFPPALCHPASSTFLQIFPPNQTTPVYLAYSTTACLKPIHLLRIDAVRSGSGG
jgi:Domain of unknown function (DUF4232)